MKLYSTLIFILVLQFISCDIQDLNNSSFSVEKPLNPKAHESEISIDSNRISRGQLLFVATYSGVQWTKDAVELVGSNLSIRNTSRTESIRLLYVDFYDDHGSLHENYIESEEIIPPLGSKIFHIHQYDEKGGAGSNFLVEWASDEPVSPPFIENVSFRLSGAQSLSFSSPAIVLREKGVK